MTVGFKRELHLIFKTNKMKDNKYNVDNGDEIMQIVSGVVRHERETGSSPFLTERIMNKIESINSPVLLSSLQKVLQLTAVAASFLLMVFLGVNLGNLIKEPRNERSEIMVFNDAHLERLDILLKD